MSNPSPFIWTVSMPTWTRTSAPVSDLMPKAWPVFMATMIVPSQGAMMVPSVGTTPKPLPMAPEAKTLSGTWSSATSCPATGKPRVTVPAATVGAASSTVTSSTGVSSSSSGCSRGPKRKVRAKAMATATAQPMSCMVNEPTLVNPARPRRLGNTN